MIEIPLTQGKVAIVDDEDADLASFKWYAQRDGGTCYGVRKVHVDGRQKRVSLHRVIAMRMGIAAVGLVDHRNRDGLDCRRSNLRSATRAQNGANRGVSSNNACGYKGVRLAYGKWLAQIKVHGVQRHIGAFDSAADAARAYDAAAREGFGEFACLNFPDAGGSRE